MKNLTKLVTVIGVLACVSSCTSLADRSGYSQDIPTVHEIAELEHSIEMPLGAAPLTTYRRYYTLEDKIPSGVIWGVFLRTQSPGISIVPRLAFPSVSDGGCSVVHVRYSRADKKVTAAMCAGVA